MQKIFILLTALLILSCETFELVSLDSLNVDQENSIKIFVEGGVTSQLTHHQLTLIKPGNSTDKQTYIADAIVSVTVADKTYQYTPDTIFENIRYFSDEMFQAMAGDICTLTIMYQGYIFTATDQVDQVTEFDIEAIQVPLVEVANGTLQTIGLTKHEFGFDAPNIWYWINADEIGNVNILTSTEIKSYTHRGANLQGVFPSNVFGMVFQASGNEDVFQVAKLSVSAAHYDYLRAFFSETDWKGSVFSTIPGNLPTNLSSGGGGFFFASDVTIKSFTGKQIFEIGVID